MMYLLLLIIVLICIIIDVYYFLQKKFKREINMLEAKLETLDNKVDRAIWDGRKELGELKVSLYADFGHFRQSTLNEISLLEKIIRKVCPHKKVFKLDATSGITKSRCFNCGEYEPKVEKPDAKKSRTKKS